jgi:excinuclease ABC subunit C
VRESINLIQKLFRIRNCEDSIFSNRSRPCLQYQINRCTAPCTGLVDADTYGRQVDDALLFLRGGSQKVITRLIGRMEQAADALDYEQAARYRDQINSLKQMQARHFVSSGIADIDVIALARVERRVCLQVVTVRGGRNLGQRSHYPVQSHGHSEEEVLQAFLGQYYRERVPAPQIIVSHPVVARELFESVFTQKAGRKVVLQAHPRGKRRQLLELAARNALAALQMKLASQSSLDRQFAELQNLLELDAPPATIECFDISHTAGNQTVGSCVVFDHNGAVKSRYRRYNLRHITPGDDYAAMQQVLSRRYRTAAESETAVPDLVIIDGGKGQLTGPSRRPLTWYSRSVTRHTVLPSPRTVDAEKRPRCSQYSRAFRASAPSAVACC